MTFSPELEWMIENKTGYRNEGFEGSNVVLLEEIIKHEMLTLGNDDIVDFFEEHYGLDFPHESFSVMYEKGEITEQEAMLLIENMITILKEKFPRDQKNICGVWLSTYEGVIENYVDEGDEMIWKYDLSEIVFAPVSDLGEQGTLFAVSIAPHFIEAEGINLDIE